MDLFPGTNMSMSAVSMSEWERLRVLGGEEKYRSEMQDGWKEKKKEKEKNIRKVDTLWVRQILLIQELDFLSQTCSLDTPCLLFFIPPIKQTRRLNYFCPIVSAHIFIQIQIDHFRQIV